MLVDFSYHPQIYDWVWIYFYLKEEKAWDIILGLTKVDFFACGALAASISVGIVIPSTWFVYLYKQTVSITVVVMGTKQFNDKTTHRQQLKTGFVQKWENRSPGLFQVYSRTFSFFKDSISSQFCKTQRFKVHFFSQKRRNE